MMKLMKSLLPLLFGGAALIHLGAAEMNTNTEESTDNNATPAAMPSQTLPLLNFQIDKGTNDVNLINTNNDPYVYTKVYRLKHADPYEVRPYLMNAVRSRRVTANETKVEAVKFMDGTGMLIVSAEDYRFERLENGMTIDELVLSLDRPGISSEEGRRFFVYYPRYFDAESLRKLIVDVGTQHELDAAELSGGIDTVRADTGLNALMFYSTPASEKVIRGMLTEYDAPATEAEISYTIYELYSENDGNLGVDFQAWKNGMGTDLFAAGASYISGWPIDAARVVKDAHANYINFNPRWNSKFLDFLVAKSRAKVLTGGSLTIMNQCTGSVANVTKFDVIADRETTSEIPASQTVETTVDPVTGAVTTKTLSSDQSSTVKKDPKIRKTNSSECGFTLNMTPEVNGRATIVSVAMNNTSLIGFKSDGTPRTSATTLNTRLMVANDARTFYIGGLEKSELVRSVSKVPFLGDIPVLGWVFSSETEQLKKSHIIAVLTVKSVAPTTRISSGLSEESDSIKTKISSSGVKNAILDENSYGFDQYLLDPGK